MKRLADIAQFPKAHYEVTVGLFRMDWQVDWHVVTVLPDVDLDPLADSPTPALANYFGSSLYQFRFTAHGHAL